MKTCCARVRCGGCSARSTRGVGCGQVSYLITVDLVLYAVSLVLRCIVEERHACTFSCNGEVRNLEFCCSFKTVV